MEAIVRIKEIKQIVERFYESKKTGKNEVFASKGFILTSGRETFYCEAIGDYARMLEQNPLSTDYYYKATLLPSVREYEDSQHVKRYATDIRLMDIAVL